MDKFDMKELKNILWMGVYERKYVQYIYVYYMSMGRKYVCVVKHFMKTLETCMFLYVEKKSKFAM